jgi:AcrR family transcriptional regulator
MDAAMEVFATRGYAATTVDDICRAAGASAATFYLHFRRKVDVLIASVEDETRSVYSAAGALWPADEPHTRDRLRAWTERLFTHWKELGASQRILGQAELVEPELGALHARRLREGVEYWEAFLRDAGARGGPRRRAEAAVMNALFVGLFEMWIVSDVALDEDDLADLVADELWRRVERYGPTR